jgi:hypothetical protein
MPLKDDLAAYWNFEQNPVLFPIHDQSGNGNHLTAHGDPVLVPGKLGQAIEFNGTNQWLDISSNAGFSHQGAEFTAILWFKPLALAHQTVLASTAEWGAQIVLSGGNFYVNVAIEDEEVTVTDVPLEVGAWCLLALGFKDASYIWASVNLSARVTALQTGLTPAPGTFSMAGSAAIGWANIVLDDTAVFRRLLSASELTAIYNRGRGLPFEDWDKQKICKATTCCQ